MYHQIIQFAVLLICLCSLRLTYPVILDEKTVIYEKIQTLLKVPVSSMLYFYMEILKESCVY